MTISSIPSFSKPITQTQYNTTYSILTNFFIGQGFSVTNATAAATLAINLKNSGYADVDIVKAINAQYSTMNPLASSNNLTTTANLKTSSDASTNTTPSKTVVASAPILTKVIVLSQSGSGFWNVQLVYSDGSTKGYSLSTANVLNDSKGVQLVDQTGKFNSSVSEPVATSTAPPPAPITIPQATPAQPSSPVHYNVGIVFRNKTSQVVDQYTLSNQVLESGELDYLQSSVSKGYGNRVVITSKVQTTKPTTINAAALLEEISATISLIDGTPIQNPTTETGSLNGATITKPVKFDIVANGISKTGVVLSGNDFQLLQNNVGVFSVENAQQGSFSPNTNYSDLVNSLKIASTSVSTPNLKTSNNASDVVDASKVQVQIKKTITQITVYSSDSAKTVYHVAIAYSDGTQQNLSLSKANVIADVASGAKLVDQTGDFSPAPTGSNTKTTSTAPPPAPNPLGDLYNYFAKLLTPPQVIIDNGTPVTAPPASTSAPTPSPDYIKQIEDALGSTISTAEANLAGYFAKITGNAPNAPTTPPLSPQPTPETPPAPTPSTTSNEKPTSITVRSQIDANTFNCTEFFADGSSTAISLSFDELNTFVKEGVSIVDLTQQKAFTTNQAATPVTLGERLLAFWITYQPILKKYSIPIILGISATSALGIALTMTRKRGIEKRV